MYMNASVFYSVQKIVVGPFLPLLPYSSGLGLGLDLRLGSELGLGPGLLFKLLKRSRSMSNVR